MRTGKVLVLFLAGCQAGCQAGPVAHTSFGGASEVTATSGPAGGGSTSGGRGETTTTGMTTTGLSGMEGAETTGAGPSRDLGGMPDFGDGAPIGCKGKIDFLFVVSRGVNMRSRQVQLAAAFPQFIETIESKFADFDYHIMVVDGDNSWGNATCTELCPELACKVGEPCCPWGDVAHEGQPCCSAPDYPCEKLALLSICDTAWGAGSVFPAGVDGEANKPCPIDGGRRYLVKGQDDLKASFQCIAAIGSGGWGALGQALVAAVQAHMNKLGGCNPGFLRDDALLMVTFIANSADFEGFDSEGTVAEWAEAVRDAKHGDDESVVMLSIYNNEAQWKQQPKDRISSLAMMFPYHHLEDSLADDYGEAFVEAANLVETACAGFVAPG